MTASKSKHFQMEESKISFITKTSDGTSSMCTSIFNTGRVTAVTAGCTSASCLGGQRWPAASGGPFCFYGRRSFPAAPPLKREENSKLEKLEQHFHRILYILAVSSVRGQKKSFWFTEKTSPNSSMKLLRAAETAACVLTHADRNTLPLWLTLQSAVWRKWMFIQPTGVRPVSLSLHCPCLIAWG